MNLRDLTYLVMLYEHGHFGKAADACFVSQPALSMQIKKLEDSLNVQLLERNNKSILFTPTGLAIVEQARKILREVEELRHIAKLAKDPYSGELKIGIIPTLAPYLLPIILTTLSKAFPKISFYLVEEKTQLLVEKLKEGSLDAALLAIPISEPQFNSQLLFEEEFLLATPKTHPLAKRKIIKQQDLSKHRILLLEEGHCMREPTLALCHSAQTSEAKNFRATSLETLRHMVAAGVGITLMPQLAQKSNDHIAYMPFAAPKPTRSIALFWRTSTAKENLLQDIAIHIKKAMQKR